MTKINYINSVHLNGFVGKDPVSLLGKNNTPFVSVSLATNIYRPLDKDFKKFDANTTWHNLVFFGDQMKYVIEHIKKGMSLEVKGRLDYKEWQDKKGSDHLSANIVVKEILGNKEVQDEDAGVDVTTP